jgi:hypothetical protein
MGTASHRNICEGAVTAIDIGDTSSDHRPSTAWVDSFEGVTRAAFALFLTVLVALLIALYAGVPLPDSWPDAHY